MSKKDPKTQQTDQPQMELEQDKQFEEWKAFAKSIELSKSDSAIIEMASNAMIDAISNKAYNSLMILFNTYNRIYKFGDIGSITKNGQIVQATKSKKKVGEYSMTLNNEKCKLLFNLFGVDMEVVYKQKFKFL